MKIDQAIIAHIELPSQQVIRAVNATEKRNLRQVSGFISTVSTKLKTYHNEKNIRQQLHFLEKQEVSYGTLCAVESLILWAHEAGAFGVKHKAQALKNKVTKELSATLQEVV
jgi:glutathionylspermidine synthase